MTSFLLIFFITITTLGNLSAQAGECKTADSLVMTNEYLRAIEFYNKCYESDTTNKKVLSSLAFCYFHLGDYAAAKVRYHVLEHDSSYQSDAISKLAQIYESQQNLPKAIKYNIALSKKFPSNPIYYRKLGAHYLLGNEQKQAIDSYQKAMQLNERDILTIQGMSELYLSMDSLLIADNLLTKGLVFDSSHIGLSLLKARVKYRQRAYHEVASILHKLTFATELNNYYNKLLGYSFMQIDSLDKAIYHLQKSLLNEGDPEYALYYLALAHEKKSEYDKAIWFFEEAAKAGISTNMAQYHRGMARIYTHQKAYPKVLSQYQKSLEYQSDAEVYFYMANAAEQMSKKKNSAINYYQKYLDSEHSNEEWIKHSKSRIKALKEYEFMIKK